MTAKEFSDRFDVLWNNIASNEAPGLNEYEKSVFLTKAQDELLKNYFNAGGNKYQQGFDGNNKRQIDFSMVMRTAEENPQSVSNSSPILQFDPRSEIYKMPKDLFLFINEQVLLWKVTGEGGSEEASLKAIRQVVPVAYDEYTRLMSKPFKEPLKYQAWRLISSASSDSTATTNTIYAEILLTSADKNEENYNVHKYRIRYIKRPRPILLANFSEVQGENISINGYKGGGSTAEDFLITQDSNPCELDPILHEEILQRAVELAKISYGADQSQSAQLNIQSGQRSE